MRRPGAEDRRRIERAVLSVSGVRCHPFPGFIDQALLARPPPTGTFSTWTVPSFE